MLKVFAMLVATGLAVAMTERTYATQLPHGSCPSSLVALRNFLPPVEVEPQFRVNSSEVIYATQFDVDLGDKIVFVVKAGSKGFLLVREKATGVVLDGIRIPYQFIESKTLIVRSSPQQLVSLIRIDAKDGPMILHYSLTKAGKLSSVMLATQPQSGLARRDHPPASLLRELLEKPGNRQLLAKKFHHRPEDFVVEEAFGESVGNHLVFIVRASYGGFLVVADRELGAILDSHQLPETFLPWVTSLTSSDVKGDQVVFHIRRDQGQGRSYGLEFILSPAGQLILTHAQASR